ncbi:MAG: quinolinate synthase NadA [Bdellovibrionota bacterium]
MTLEVLDQIPSPSSSSSSSLSEAILELKAKKNAVILSHYYQEGGIQDVADYVGDSLGLAQYGAKVNARIIVLAGVVFMAETAKILSPDKLVLCPDLNAGCSLADNCPADEFRAFKAKYPGHTVVTYVNCSAEVKALSDILCTSSNAVKIIESIPKDQPIIFGPDQHLGRYLIKKTGRDMVLWQGSCIVHETFDVKRITQLKARYPESLVIAHPECRDAVLSMADHIGSTSSLLKFTQESPAKEFIVVTEAGILHQMEKASPHKIFHAAPNAEHCNCAECPFMRLNSLEKIYRCLQNEQPQVRVPEEIRRLAVIPLERMLALS